MGLDKTGSDPSGGISSPILFSLIKLEIWNMEAFIGRKVFEKEHVLTCRKWQDYVYIQCEYKSTKQKIMW